MYEKNGAEYSTRTECIDWRYSAAILGLVKFYEYAQIKGFDLKFDYDEDYIYYNIEDITEELFLDFAENSFKKEIETMLEKMKEIIAEQLSVDADSITEASSFKDDLGADSLDLFELVMALEDEYSVEIPAEDLQNLATVGDVMNYLKEKGVEA